MDLGLVVWEAILGPGFMFIGCSVLVLGSCMKDAEVGALLVWRGWNLSRWNVVLCLCRNGRVSGRV